MVTGITRLLLLAMLASGGVLVFFGLFSLGQLLRFRRHDRVHGGGFDAGLLAVEGTARPTGGGGTIRSPVTDARSLLYEYGVQRRTGSPATPTWRTVVSGQDGVPFFIENEAGRALVEPAGVALELGVADEIEFDADPDELDDDHPAMAALEVAHDGDSVVLGGLPLERGDRYRVVERRIEPGDTVPVTGYATAAESNPAGSGTDEFRVVLRASRGRIRRFFGVPYVIGDAAGGAGTILRNRAFTGGLFGLPLVMLALVLMFPP